MSVGRSQRGRFRRGWFSNLGDVEVGTVIVVEVGERAESRLLSVRFGSVRGSVVAVVFGSGRDLVVSRFSGRFDSVGDGG